MYKNKLILHKTEVIPPIPNYMIPVDFCQNNSSMINFTTDDMTSKFGLFSKNKMNYLYIPESMETDWPQMLYEHWDERYTPYSDAFEFCPKWLFQYFNALQLGETLKVLILRGTWNNT